MTHPLPKRALRFAIVTVSDTRTKETDVGGDAAAEIARKGGHEVARREIVRDDRDAIAAAFHALLADDRVEAIVLTGGTGVAPRDVTPEAILPDLDRVLPGFGEAFRRLSFDEIGPAGLLSRAEAGVARGKPVFLLPGSPAGVRLAMERLVLAMAPHARELSSA